MPLSSEQSPTLPGRGYGTESSRPLRAEDDSQPSIQLVDGPVRNDLQTQPRPADTSSSLENPSVSDFSPLFTPPLLVAELSG